MTTIECDHANWQSQVLNKYFVREALSSYAKKLSI